MSITRFISSVNRSGAPDGTPAGCATMGVIE
jgi:hypothetical protein